jgi:tryptophanyl-tRNA synthetase
MFASAKALKKSVMGIVTDSTPVEEPKDTTSTVFQLWSLFANESEREAMFARAKAGGLGYGDVKKDLLQRLLDHFGPMRERRAELEKRPDDVEDILSDGAHRAALIGEPVLAAARESSGIGPTL